MALLLGGAFSCDAERCSCLEAGSVAIPRSSLQAFAHSKTLSGRFAGERRVIARSGRAAT
jgi:hypothetical protein